MGKDDAIAALAALQDELSAEGVTALHLFGSTVDGRAGPGSDLDIFLDHAGTGRFSLFDLVGVKQLIEDRLGVTADVTTRGGLHPMLKDSIERSAVRVF